MLQKVILIISFCVIQNGECFEEYFKGPPVSADPLPRPYVNIINETTTNGDLVVITVINKKTIPGLRSNPTNKNESNAKKLLGDVKRLISRKINTLSRLGEQTARFNMSKNIDDDNDNEMNNRIDPKIIENEDQLVSAAARDTNIRGSVSHRRDPFVFGRGQRAVDKSKLKMIDSIHFIITLCKPFSCTYVIF